MMVDIVISKSIYSSGTVLYAMLCDYLPFKEESNEKLYN